MSISFGKVSTALHTETWRVVGKQRFLIDGDTVHWNIHGSVSGHELTTIFEEAFCVQTARGYVLLSINTAGEWALSAEARQALSRFHSTHKAVGATAVVGSSAKMAMFVDIVLRGVAKVSGKRPKTRFFSTSQDATSWLDEERTRFRNNLPSPMK